MVPQKTNKNIKIGLMLVKINRLLFLLIISNFLMIQLNASPSASPMEQISALTVDRENGKRVFQTCSLCHSPQGWGTSDGYYPQLSGQHPNVLIKQLIDIQSGKRDVPTMIPFAETIFYQGEQNVADVVAYISSLPMNPENGVGPGDKLKRGEAIYKHDCQKCHGSNGEGVNQKSYPRIQGQHYQYLLRQIKWIKNGMRNNGDVAMKKVIANYTEEEMKAVADYISRIKPRKSLLAETADWKNPDFTTDFKSAPWLRHESTKTE